ncbi:hypothetical protein N803_09020 [Knoellia subterranea KCTC 19937]|uniref:Uncharacterized protein n=1 Tax=Knoellia subterranea KCTC 19937 TaxID=1385521 RepID=A0A0A0JTB6_9MICO|nr:hypothetical protein N803_09020 [Knoellia subterranea KCTC 19937]
MASSAARMDLNRTSEVWAEASWRMPLGSSRAASTIDAASERAFEFSAGRGRPGAQMGSFAARLGDFAQRVRPHLFGDLLRSGQEVERAARGRECCCGVHRC